ncbi:MAG: U32 family peptidase [Oscillospiraceae bacterium]|nr:U32 family peptidase [Oscillospiraceae bacterium]
MLELLSPAGSPESVIAAVQNGADAVYMGLGDFNARRGAKNFTPEDFEKAVRYCRVRGCRVYVTMNTLIGDREMKSAVQQARLISDVGADAILVQDLGLLSVLKRTVPDIPLHASTQMSIHSLAGVEAAAEMGLSRAVLARELSFEQIKYITKHSPIETEIFVHGALCFCHSGQCYMSSLIGKRSGNRGMCAQPCRLEYSMGGRMEDTHPLSLRDNCLVEHLREIEDAGVACVKIEGRMKRPEYTGIVTGVYSRVIKERRAPTPDELASLANAFSRQGFTQGYFTGDKKDMFGVRREADKSTEKFYEEFRKTYTDSEINRVPVSFRCRIVADDHAKLIADDLDGNQVGALGAIPSGAIRKPITAEDINARLSKTGGTPYYCTGITTQVQDGLYLTASQLNDLRRNVLETLSTARAKPPERRSLPMPEKPEARAASAPPVSIYQVRTADQLSPALAELSPELLYMPLTEMYGSFDSLKPFTDRGTVPVAVLPRVITDSDTVEVSRMLKELYSRGIRQTLVGNLGHVLLSRRAGFETRADFGLNIFNSFSMEMTERMGLLSATASFELRLAQVKDMAKRVDTELIVYGRLPLMVSEQCIISRNAGRCSCSNPNQLSDRKGKLFPVVREFDHRNVIYNADKLYMADRLEDVAETGVWGQRLMFTTESARECLEVAKGYKGLGDYRPAVFTRGLYYRGVE